MFLPELDLYYYRARIYNPALGRFLQTDPVGYEDQMNLYAYVHNDPMNNIDPTGKNTVAGGVVAVGGFVCSRSSGCVRAVGSAVATGIAWGASHFNESASDEVSDLSGKPGTKDDVDQFVEELDGISEPQSDRGNIRILEEGIKVKDLQDKAPGEPNDKGRKNTAEGGNIGTHDSASTRREDGSRCGTLCVSRPNQDERKVIKYRER